MANGLTARMLAFCKNYAKTPTIQGAVNAYRKAYRTNASDESVRRAAMRLLKHPAVAEFVGLIQEKAAKRAVLSMEDHLDKLAELRDMAAGDGSYAAAITAEKARGQVVGLYVEKQQVQGDICITWKENGAEDPA